MSRSDPIQDERHVADRPASDADRHARQPPDTRQRAIEHGAEEYYRREGSAAERERAGRPLAGGDAEAGGLDGEMARDRSR